MKRYIFTGLLVVVVAIVWCLSIYNAGRTKGFREGLEISKPAEPPEEKPVLKTESEAWEATKLFVSASLKNGHTASFQNQRAADVVTRTGDKSFTIRAIVWSRDADGRITPKNFECRMTHLEAGKWRGGLTLTEDRKLQPKPEGEVI